MSSGVRRNVVRVRTFSDDVSRVRQDKSLHQPIPTVVSAPPTAVPTPPIPTSTVSGNGNLTIPTTTPVGSGVPKVAARETEEPRSPQIEPPAVSRPEVTPAKNTTINSPVITDALKAVATTTFGSVGTPSFDAEDDPFGAEGTMVTDKKRNRFRLLPAIGAAVSNWAGDTKSALTRSEPEQVVTKAESRVETLKAAAKQSYQAPQDDHGVVIKRLTEKERTPVTTEVNIKSATAVPTPTWTHVQVAAEETLEVAEEVEVEVKKATAPAVVAPAAVQTTEPIARLVKPAPVSQPEPFIPPRVSPPVSIPVTRVPATTSHPSPVYATKPTPVSQRATVQKLEPMIPLEAPAPQTQPAVSRIQPVTPVVVSAAPVVSEPAVPRATIVPEVVAQPTQPLPVKQNERRTLFIFVAVILGAAFLGVGVTTLWYLRATPGVSEVAILRIPSLVNVSVNTPVPLRSERNDNLRELTAATTLTNETQQLYFVTDEGTAVSQPADTVTILERLAFRAPGSFTRSIKALTFGSYAGSQPFIVLHVTDFNTAFAGMLQWETNMSADLTPLFGNVVTESFDSTARTVSQLRNPFFRDTIVANVSTRLLVDAAGTERILYGFVKPNIILITSDQTTFEAVAPLITTTP